MQKLVHCHSIWKVLSARQNLKTFANSRNDFQFPKSNETTWNDNVKRFTLRKLVWNCDKHVDVAIRKLFTVNLIEVFLVNDLALLLENRYTLLSNPGPILTHQSEWHSSNSAFSSQKLLMKYQCVKQWLVTRHFIFVLFGIDNNMLAQHKSNTFMA